MPDFSLQQLLLRFVGILLIVAVHGYVLASLTKWFGDKGPEYDGRLTLNPFSHLDVVGMVAMLLFSVGWIRPLKLDPRQLRRPKFSVPLIVFGSLLTTLVFAVLLRMMRPVLFAVLPDGFSFTVILLINTLVTLSIWFVVFNLLPLLPLTAGYLLGVLNTGWLERVRRYEWPIKLGLAVLILSGIVSRILSPAHAFIAGVIERGI